MSVVTKLLRLALAGVVSDGQVRAGGMVFVARVGVGAGGGLGVEAADAHGPAGQVVGEDVQGQPGGVGPEAPGGQMVEPDPVFEVPDGVFAVGVGPMPGVELDGVAVQSVMKAW